MRIEKISIFKLNIPFKLDFTHAKASRLFSDSFIIKIETNQSAGFGEAVVRDYVSGEISTDEIKKAVEKILKPVYQKEITGNEIQNYLQEVSVNNTELPLLCAVETAVFDLLCKISGKDIYQLLNLNPLRKTVFYGGTLPILPLKSSIWILEAYNSLKLSNVRIKIGKDTEYNNNILNIAREKMGKDCDLRVDANGIWELEDAYENFSILDKYGITIIEEPFGKDPGKMLKIKENNRNNKFRFVADESALNLEDMKEMAVNNTFQIVNIRLSKNGGLTRSLKMAETAEKLGLQYQLGCHVGETGILSAAGRAAASLFPNPLYTDGSYDSYLLSDNITIDDFKFGSSGKADIIRGNCIGYEINEKKLARLSDGQFNCF